MAAASAFGLYEYVLEQPFAQGVSDLAKAIGDRQQNDSDRFGAAVQVLSAQAANAVLSPLFGGTLAGGIERAIDPGSSNTMPDDPSAAQSGPVVRGFAQALQRARSRNPLTADEVAPLLNVWGEVVKPTAGGTWELFWPFRTTGGDGGKLEETLFRLGGVLSMPERKWSGTNVALTARQYNELIRQINASDGTGLTLREELTDLVEDPDFGLDDPAEQITAIRRVYARRVKVARDQVLIDVAPLAERVQTDRDFRAVFGRPPRGSASPFPSP
jgi:hypothetical protein